LIVGYTYISIVDFSSKCFPMSPTSYPKNSMRRVLMQSGCHSPWLRPDLCTYPVYMTEIFLIILLCCEISLIHIPLHNVFYDVLSVYARAFVEIDHDATRNVIGMQPVVTWHFLIQVLWSPDKVISPFNHHVNLISLFLSKSLTNS
jgi:hypothetical protein